jgi:hypothetical protein
VAPRLGLYLPGRWARIIVSTIEGELRMTYEETRELLTNNPDPDMDAGEVELVAR